MSTSKKGSEKMTLYIPVASFMAKLIFNNSFFYKQAYQKYSFVPLSGHSDYTVFVRASDTKKPHISVEYRKKILTVDMQKTKQAFYDLKAYICIFLAYFLIEDDTMLFHASAVFKDKKAYLFAGPSGTGKSTIRQISENNSLVALSDDVTIVKRVGGEYKVYGCPFEKDVCTQASGKIITLHKIFFPLQSTQTYITHIIPHESLSLLINNNFLIYKDSAVNKKKQLIIHDIAKNDALYKTIAKNFIISHLDLTSKVTTYKMFFQKNDEFIKLL